MQLNNISIDQSFSKERTKCTALYTRSLPLLIRFERKERSSNAPKSCCC
jgi:hypothetical protein